MTSETDHAARSTGSPVAVEITDLAFDGKSVGHIDGKVVFLNAGLPGEQVLAQIVRSKPRYSQAVVREIIRKSPSRIPPVCEHFGECGGCTWQDLDYQEQLKYKRMQVVACLERIGGLSDVQVAPVVGSADQFFYRNKMEFSFHTAKDSGFTLGLHRSGRFDEIFDLRACHLQSEKSNHIVAWIREFIRSHQIPVYDVLNHTGYMRFLVIREGKRTGQVLVNLVTNYGDFPFQNELVRGLREAVPDITSIVHNQNGQKSNIATGEIETVLYGPGWIEEIIAGKHFRILANSFFQTNSLQAERLYSLALDLVEMRPTDRLLDLYCGTGTIGILAAPRVQEVVGVELVEEAVKVACENAGLNNIENITFYSGHVKEVLRSEELVGRAFNIVVLDPPRAGLHPRALKRVLEIGAGKILYISCNPATFARDAKELIAAGYNLPGVTPVDMFPHTKHIETVACFTRT